MDKMWWCVTQNRESLKELRTMPHCLKFLASGKLSKIPSCVNNQGGLWVG